MLSLASVWDIIDPANPDNVRYQGDGLYSADWSPANPDAADAEIIRRTPGVQVVSDLHPHPDLPGWTRMTFRLDRSAVSQS